MTQERLPPVGFQVWGQFTDWPAMAATARRIEALGFSSLWANDHFFPPAGRQAATPEGLPGPYLEGWMTAAGFAMVTERIPVGVLVSGAGYREAGLLVKMGTALDHLSGGRALLGLGAGWHIRDHAAFGFRLPPIGARLDRLDEQSRAIRALLDGREFTASGTWVTMDRAVNDPPPIGRLPLVIGGSGVQRTLRIVARDADVWNGEGTPEEWGRRSAVLDAHCAEVGRDPAAIRRTVGIPPIHIRATTDEARRSLAAILERHGIGRDEAIATATDDRFAGSLDDILRALRAYVAVGAEEVISDWPAPFDDETLERLAGALGPSAAAASTRDPLPDRDAPAGRPG